jgi:hypothetical protein
MTFRVLDTVILKHDLPAYGLCEGDIGAVVEVYDPDGLDVEFVTASGRTLALLTLIEKDVRRPMDNDLLAVRSLRAAV